MSFFKESKVIRLKAIYHLSAIALTTKRAIALPPSFSIPVHLQLLKRAIALTTKSAIALKIRIDKQHLIC
ncbi:MULTISPECIES: hypothetical protein [unclassified Microcoleus]|uniref:hypothetical protein n=1 Tax=unclassified Microcoleus TaxID=2642155 RepID=UPI002FD0A3F4